VSHRFDILTTAIDGLHILPRDPMGDRRGCLERLFCAQELQPIMTGRPVVQINRTLTVRSGTVRGLHFQVPPHAEMKLISCLRGEVFDVAVDIRTGSPTFLQWHAEILSPDNHKTMAIPEGFAHGFQTLTDDCEMLYFHTAYYNAKAEGGLNPKDPKLGIGWPLAVADLSERDSKHAWLTPEYKGIPA
jgi:dTDP-4-dehydrorhamnose 3,5-epimerase